MRAALAGAALGAGVQRRRRVPCPSPCTRADASSPADKRPRAPKSAKTSATATGKPGGLPPKQRLSVDDILAEFKLPDEEEDEALLLSASADASLGDASLASPAAAPRAASAKAPGATPRRNAGASSSAGAGPATGAAAAKASAQAASAAPGGESAGAQRVGLLDGIEYVKGTCYGCGVGLQVSTPEAPGYVKKEKYDLKARHKQLGLLCCTRCAALANGAMVNAVIGQGTTGRKPGLVTAEQLRAHLAALRDEKALIVMVVDALDFQGTFLTRLRDAIGSNPIVLVVTKADYLPKLCDLDKLAQWIEDEVAFKRMMLVGLHLVSSRTGEGVDRAVKNICSLRAGRNVYVVGAANVGKSSFINRAVGQMRATGNFAAQDRRLPVASPMPGTTLGVIKIDAFEGKGALYDTPGVVLSHRLNMMLDGEDLRRLNPTRALEMLRPERRSPSLEEAGEAGDAELSGLGGRIGAVETYEEPVIEGTTFFLEGLVRVDVVAAPANSSLIFFGHRGVRIRSLSTKEADAGVWPWRAAASSGEAASALAESKDHIGSDGDEEEDDAPAIGWETVKAKGGLRVARECEFTAGIKSAPLADIVVSGLGGWICVVSGGGKGRKGGGALARVALRVWTPRGVEVFVRPPLPALPPDYFGR